MRRWRRSAAEPAHAFPATADRQPGRLPQRDFDLGRGLGLLPGGGPPPAATTALLTAGDRRADWLRAGQALHRLLAHAASKWVFASLHTQPLETGPIRALIRDRLALPAPRRCCCSPDPPTPPAPPPAAHQPTSPNPKISPQGRARQPFLLTCCNRPTSQIWPGWAVIPAHTIETPRRSARSHR
jgi:hypothetical protein